MVNQYNFAISQGSDISFSLVATGLSGNPLNLSGCSAVAGVKYGYASTGYLINLSPQIDPSLVSGIINIYVSGAFTTGLPITKAVWDMDIINSGAGTTTKVFYGYCEIFPEVSLF